MIEPRPQSATAPTGPATLAWAGWELHIPASWRLHALEGDHQRGRLILTDDQRQVLHFFWRSRRRPRRPQRLATLALRRLLRAGRRLNAQQLSSDTQQTWLQARALRPDADGRVQRGLAGYCASSQRLALVLLADAQVWEHLDEPQADVSTCCRAQPLDQPQRYAFFDLSFTLPAGVRLWEHQLNLGNMWVHAGVGHRPGDGPSVAVREIYPAQAALQRQPLEKWLETLLRQNARAYRPASARGPLPSEPVTTLVGEGLTTERTLRRRLRLLWWRAPRVCRSWLLHDRQRNRLIAIDVAAAPPQQAQWFAQIVRGLHGALRASPPRSHPKGDA